MIQIEQEKCNVCGICGIVCPRHIPEIVKQENEKVTVISEERIHLCMECGHCEAVCPEFAIHVDKLKGQDFDESNTIINMYPNQVH